MFSIPMGNISFVHLGAYCGSCQKKEKEILDGDWTNGLSVTL